MTHMDIAQFLYEDIQGTVVCTSQTGRGMWYFYDFQEHRWVFDREGTRVLLKCSRMLRAYLNAIRMELAGRQESDAPDAGSSTAPRRRSSVSITRIIKDTDDLDLGTEIMAQLTNATGDFRQLQSIVKALGTIPKKIQSHGDASCFLFV